MKWNDLIMSQRSDLMKLYLKHGITSLDAMREHYNSFATGGHLYQDGGILDKIKSYFAPTYGGSFEQAYKAAVQHGDEYFKWNGNRYNTKNSNLKKKPDADIPDYSQLPFNKAYKKASNNLPLNGEFGWNGAVYAANDSTESEDLSKLPVYKLWEVTMKQPWSKAKEWGFTDGQAKTNLGLRKALLKVANNAKSLKGSERPVAALATILENTEEREAFNYNFNVPSDETPITIKDPKAGKNQGTIFFPTVLDSLAVHGFNTKTSPVITFGLPAQESAMSPLYGEQTVSPDDYNKSSAAQMMFSAWDIDKTPLDGLWSAMLNAKYTLGERGAEEVIKKGAPYSFRQYTDYVTPKIIDWSYDKFKKGTYNTGDKNHSSDVLKRGLDFIQSKEVRDDWFYKHWLPKQSNKQEWLDWWNSR